MSRLTEKARGRECQVRLCGVCNRDDATTVLAHVRMAGLCGMGSKPHDLIGAWACSACHDEIDRRTRHLPATEARLAHLEGMARTLDILIREGVVTHE